MDIIPYGYYIKARIIKEKPVAHAPPHIREIWDYCLREANHSPNKYGKYTIKRGQLFRSYKDIQDDLCWFIGWRKETYNENQMKGAMKYLRDNDMILTRKQLGGVLITVLNYDYYNDPKNYERTNEATNETTLETTYEQPTSPDNNKNGKKVKKVKKVKNKHTYSKEFEECWKIVPKRNGVKEGKKPSSILFEKLEYEEKRKCYRGLKNYADLCNRTDKKPKDFERFIKHEIYNDYQEPIINNQEPVETDADRKERELSENAHFKTLSTKDRVNFLVKGNMFAMFSQLKNALSESEIEELIEKLLNSAGSSDDLGTCSLASAQIIKKYYQQLE